MTERTPRPELVTEPDPERLARDPALGKWIERANAGYRAGLDEAQAFKRLSERLEPRRGSLLTWQRVSVGAALSFAAAAALVLATAHEAPSPVAFGPEISSARRSGVSAEKVTAGEPAAAGPLGARPLEARSIETGEGRVGVREDGVREDGVRGDGTSEDGVREHGVREHGAREDGVREDGALREPPGEASRLEPAREMRPPKSTRLPRPDGASPAEAPAEAHREKRVGGVDGHAARADDAPSSLSPAPDNRVDCLDLARKGDSHAAEVCFTERAAGTGLSAEMALYEMARLRRDVLRDPRGALSALDDYRQRFPQGSLRHEVSITRVELLSDVGRGREALTESAALLASASGQERAAELHLLRGNVFRRDLADAKSAAAEYAQAEALGGALVQEATRLQGVSREAMGDTSGAIAAYRRYLARADVPRKAEVLRRIEALTGAANAGGGAASTGAAGTGAAGTGAAGSSKPAPER